jgi:Anti-sigma factor NepR
MFSMSVNRLKNFEALGAAPDPKATPDPKAAQAIGRALEAHYADLIQAPLPDKFLELLARLNDGEQVSSPKGRLDAVD